MWQRLPETSLDNRAAQTPTPSRIPKPLRAVIATIIFAATVYGISYADSLLGKQSAGAAFNLQKASAPALLAVFLATASFAYFLFVKNRKPPVIFICYACQEPFHAEATCPACGSADVSDIRLAEWKE